MPLQLTVRPPYLLERVLFACLTWGIVLGLALFRFGRSIFLPGLLFGVVAAVPAILFLVVLSWKIEIGRDGLVLVRGLREKLFVPRVTVRLVRAAARQVEIVRWNRASIQFTTPRAKEVVEQTRAWHQSTEPTRTLSVELNRGDRSMDAWLKDLEVKRGGTGPYREDGTYALAFAVARDPLAEPTGRWAALFLLRGRLDASESARLRAETEDDVEPGFRKSIALLDARDVEATELFRSLEGFCAQLG